MPHLPLQPLRLHPGQDLRPTLEAHIAAQGCRAAFLVSGIGSLSCVQLRLAGAPQASEWVDDIEILTLAGTLGPGMSHLHATIALADGRVIGGHLGPGCQVRTTAEVLLALLPNWDFNRALDPSTGYAELVVQPRTHSWLPGSRRPFV